MDTHIELNEWNCQAYRVVCSGSMTIIFRLSTDSICIRNQSLASIYLSIISGFLLRVPFIKCATQKKNSICGEWE